ncbi:tRNA (guanine-N(7)-)-methyltransferase [Buchnera aphidicola (Nipponaphis monzeni)]|uniref:tRNA (guanine-N(7)-)-methyltransferase n=1 Tax=Buchnera aphidicola (Nipponaphis monzeni) TaxID=2495405 RepID=A0A455TAR3_9GAMM|nr:tRNA (guanosine(46)-N7)-methyltransferase TrmB [Buchnera aphidicola]BBI01423.1 tRNA (guanine-N(7)-)-methyltransferase [Buchnera aphidicola (Nipponaphis monzeni)]
MNFTFKKNIISPHYNENGIFIRKNRSFIIRQKKLSKSKINIINYYWPYVGIDFQKDILNIETIFSKKSPLMIDIGFGNGHFLINMVKKNININFLGIEVYLPGIYYCVNQISLFNIFNLKIIYHDAVEVLRYMIPDNSISKIFIFFPDPWHKKKHYKRRLLTQNFIYLLSNKLIRGGAIYIKTDWKPYAYDIVSNISYIDCLYQVYLSEYVTIEKKPDEITNFEKKGLLLGRSIIDLIFLKK